MSERLVKVWVPGKVLEDLNRDRESGDPVAQSIYQRDLELVAEALGQAGIVEAGDVIRVNFLPDDQVSVDTPKRTFKIIELVKDSLGQVVDAHVDFYAGDIEFDNWN